MIKLKSSNLKKIHTSNTRGVTLIALIITIIVLVILAAVSISVAYKSKVIDYATESSQDYAQESLIENKIIEGTTELLDSTVNRIAGIFNGESTEGGGTTPEEPVQVGKTESELKELEGNYVAYVPNGSKYEIDGWYSGYSSGDYVVDSTTERPANRVNQTFSGTADTNKGFVEADNTKWRILYVNEEKHKMTLILDGAGPELTLQGADGYNNGVKILNDMCETLYGNTAYTKATDSKETPQFKVRNINMDDIDKLLNTETDEQRKKENSLYMGYSRFKNGRETYTYPNIYALEPAGKGTTEGLNRSKSPTNEKGETIFITGMSSGGGIKYTTTTYYSSFSRATGVSTQGTLWYAMLTNFGKGESTSKGDKLSELYWVSSRCSDGVSAGGFFSLHCAYSSQVSWTYMVIDRVEGRKVWRE